ncbi:MAG: dephospho-CoA kinase [Verrucomicrobia bacterium]|nr:dephospho-CoA kinase [Verrucomicrobiota bacterium]
MLKLGLTGGIGCGKSTAARMFELRGFHRLDSDQIVRDEVYADAVVREALQERFGAAVLDACGAVHRPELARRVFEDDRERAWLEDLVHPRVVAAWQRHWARGGGRIRWVVEVPLLFEKGLENWFDFTVCVALAPEVQLARLEQRGLPRALAGQRISKQLPLTRKIELSDFVLWNQGSTEFLEAQVGRLAHALEAA